MLRRASVLAVLASAAVAAPSQAIVGGQDASPGEYPSVANITFAAFGCTGTLIAPDAVLTAGHCGSITGGTSVGTPVGWPTPLITVTIGGTHEGEGETVPVKSVTVEPKYLATSGYDVSILKLAKASTKTPTRVAGAGETGIWSVGTPETIVGWGVTTEGGDAPDTLQEAVVPRVADAGCASAYSDFDAATMLCAGYAAGGIDTCQGDSGGPMFGGSGAGLRVVGATSYGEGCARPNTPGVYARVGDSALREWIRSVVPAGVAG